VRNFPKLHSNNNGYGRNWIAETGLLKLDCWYLFLMLRRVVPLISMPKVLKNDKVGEALQRLDFLDTIPSLTNVVVASVVMSPSQTEDSVPVNKNNNNNTPTVLTVQNVSEILFSLASSTTQEQAIKAMKMLADSMASLLFIGLLSRTTTTTTTTTITLTLTTGHREGAENYHLAERVLDYYIAYILRKQGLGVKKCTP
jgi:hypothetical protein